MTVTLLSKSFFAQKQNISSAVPRGSRYSTARKRSARLCKLYLKNMIHTPSLEEILNFTLWKIQLDSVFIARQGQSYSLGGARSAVLKTYQRQKATFLISKGISWEIVDERGVTLKISLWAVTLVNSNQRCRLPAAVRSPMWHESFMQGLLATLGCSSSR